MNFSLAAFLMMFVNSFYHLYRSVTSTSSTSHKIVNEHVLLIRCLCYLTKVSVITFIGHSAKREVVIWMPIIISGLIHDNNVNFRVNGREFSFTKSWIDVRVRKHYRRWHTVFFTTYYNNFSQSAMFSFISSSWNSHSRSNTVRQ